MLGIVLVEHFGDIVACEPVIRHLRHAHPDDVLLWLVRPTYRELLEGHPDLDGCVEVRSQTEAILVTTHGVFDDVFDLHVAGRSCRWLGTSFEKRRGDPSISINNYLDYGSLLEAFSRSAGLPALTEPPIFHVTAAVPAHVAALLPQSHFIAVHGATNDGLRDWTEEGWAQLVRWFHDHTDLSLVEIGHRPVVARPGNGVIDLCGKLTLQQTAALIARSAGFIGVESGPAHVANALVKKSLILMGHYFHWTQYMPYTGFLRDQADTMLLRWNGPVAAIPSAACVARVREIWPEHLRTTRNAGGQAQFSAPESACDRP